MEGTLERISPADVARWVPMEVSTQEVEDYLWQKSLFPATIPATATTLAIEQGLVREILRYAAQAYLEDYPDCAMTFEPIFCRGARRWLRRFAGAVFAHAVRRASAYRREHPLPRPLRADARFGGNCRR